MADALYVIKTVSFNIESGSDTACELEGDTPDAINEFVIVKNPEHVEVRNPDMGAGTFTLVAPTGFVGSDSMKVMIKDDAGASDPVEIPINVFASVAPPPIKLPPSARPMVEPSPATDAKAAAATKVPDLVTTSGTSAPGATSTAKPGTSATETKVPDSTTTSGTSAPARATIKCPKCSIPNTLGAVYCQNCGTLIAAGTAPAAASATPDPVAETTVPGTDASTVKRIVKCENPSRGTNPPSVHPEETPAAHRTAPSAASTAGKPKPKKEKEDEKKSKASDPEDETDTEETSETSDPAADKKGDADKASWLRKMYDKHAKLARGLLITALALILLGVIIYQSPNLVASNTTPAASSGSAEASTSAPAPVSASAPASASATTAHGALCPGGYISIPATKENVCRYLGYPSSEVPDEISTSPGPGRLLVCREVPTGSGVADITEHDCMICWPKQVKLGEKTPATVAAPLLWNQQANHMKPPSWASQTGQPRYPNCGEVQMLDCEVVLNPDGSENNSACNVLPPAL